MNRLCAYLDSPWYFIFMEFMNNSKEYENGYREATAFSYSFNPSTSYVMSYNSSLFDPKKALAMLTWYDNADAEDKMIIEYFDEYKHCVDENHKKFNSNYGIYAYKQGNLRRCAKILEADKNSRHAMFCINNNDAMSDNSIDKLCTNTIQFFIRDNKLEAVIQMRSSNFVTLLPYDTFMFSVFYAHVYNRLKCTYKNLVVGKIHMQVASLHVYKKNIDKIVETKKLPYYELECCDNNWEIMLKTRLTSLANGK